MSTLLLVERIIVLAVGIVLLGLVARPVWRWWGVLMYFERMFAMGMIAVIVAPLVGVVERIIVETDYRWADSIVFIGAVWGIIGVASLARHIEEEVHACPHCGTVHRKIMFDARTPRHRE